ncbi:protein BatD [Psychroserpens burtonensis]|uniref:Protein BatD n=1 Tax=Psychroserpens burtonensis TaxID=49278 RepID=A0A5C7BDU8_9FLAO|nr:BatD family protein [Psychroserpens burtonensis]TXE16320.1 protein BatD [Psychroserpens burtonensis]
MKNLTHIWLLTTCLTCGIGFAQEQKELKKNAKSESVAKDLRDDIHLIAEASINQVPVKGELNIEYRLYISQNIGISGWELLEEPSYTGFNFETIKLENLKVENVTFKGKSYRMVVLKRDVLKAIKSGDYSVQPSQLLITAEIADASNKKDGSNFSMKQVTTTIVSNALKVNVKS